MSLDERDTREAIADFTGSHRGLRAFFYAVLKPALIDWRQDLCYNTSLSEAEMRGRQYAIAAVEEGIVRAFEGAKVQIPDWLAEELQPNERIN